MGRGSRFSPEVRERAIRLVIEQRPAHASEWAALLAVATKLGTTQGSGLSRRRIPVMKNTACLAFVLLCALSGFGQTRGSNQPEPFVSGIDKPFGLAFEKDGGLLSTGQRSDGQGVILRITTSGTVTPIIESPRDPEDSRRKTYLMTRLGPIAKLDENTVASLDNSSGELYVVDLSSSQLLKSSVFTDGRGPTYSLATGQALTVHSMGVDQENKTLFVAGPDNRDRQPSGIIGPPSGSLVLKLDFGSRPLTITTGNNKRTLAPLPRTAFLRSSEYPSSVVTAMAVSKGTMVVALRGEGLLKIGPDQSITKIRSTVFDTSDVFGLVLDSDGTLYVAASQNGANGSVYKVAANGGIEPFAQGFKVPAGMAIREHTLYVADSAAGQILRIRLVDSPNVVEIR